MARRTGECTCASATLEGWRGRGENSGSANDGKKRERSEGLKRGNERRRGGLVARAELEDAGATLKMETVVPGVDLPLVRKSFSTVRMRPNFTVPLPHSSPLSPYLNLPQPSRPPFLTCTDIHQIFQKVKLEPIFKIRWFVRFVLFPSLNIIALTFRLLSLASRPLYHCLSSLLFSLSPFSL